MIITRIMRMALSANKGDSLQIIRYGKSECTGVHLSVSHHKRWRREDKDFFASGSLGRHEESAAHDPSFRTGLDHFGGKRLFRIRGSRPFAGHRLHKSVRQRNIVVPAIFVIVTQILGVLCRCFLQYSGGGIKGHQSGVHIVGRAAEKAVMVVSPDFGHLPSADQVLSISRGEK
ncbi:hypothetical protein D3C81_694820 [compost metagenome]